MASITDLALKTFADYNKQKHIKSNSHFAARETHVIDAEVI